MQSGHFDSYNHLYWVANHAKIWFQSPKSGQCDSHDGANCGSTDQWKFQSPKSGQYDSLSPSARMRYGGKADVSIPYP